MLQPTNINTSLQYGGSVDDGKDFLKMLLHYFIFIIRNWETKCFFLHVPNVFSFHSFSYSFFLLPFRLSSFVLPDFCSPLPASLWVWTFLSVHRSLFFLSAASSPNKGDEGPDLLTSKFTFPVCLCVFYKILRWKRKRNKHRWSKRDRSGLQESRLCDQ